MYIKAGRDKDCLPRVGQWNMMNKKIGNGGNVRSCMCVNFDRNVQDSVATELCLRNGLISRACSTVCPGQVSEL